MRRRKYKEKQKANKRRIERLWHAKPQRHKRKRSKNVSCGEHEVANRKEKKRARHERTTDREDKGEQKKKGKPHKRREEGHRNDTKKTRTHFGGRPRRRIPLLPLN